MDNKPAQVTGDNWQQKVGEGFRWKENVSSWYEHRITLGEWLHKREQQIGAGNILIGWPANEQGVPDNTIHDADNMVGIYIKQP